jgi:hypothetical protein
MGLAVDSHGKLSFNEAAWIQSIVDLYLQYGIKPVRVLNGISSLYSIVQVVLQASFLSTDFADCKDYNERAAG